MITATEYFRKGKLIPFVSWKIDSTTDFGGHQVEFDFSRRQVIRSTEDKSEIIAQIHEGSKGDSLSRFIGTVESDAFIVTKRRKNWLAGLSGDGIFEITLKELGISVTNIAMRHDFHNSFKVEDTLNLTLTRNGRNYNRRTQIEGTCDEDHRDLGEVIACLLLHHHEGTVSL